MSRNAAPDREQRAEGLLEHLLRCPVSLAPQTVQPLSKQACSCRGTPFSPPLPESTLEGHNSGQGDLRAGGAGTGHYCGPWRALTVRSNQGLDALPAPLAQPMDHEKQQREDEEGGDAADDQAHPTSHGVKQAAAICEEEEEEGSRSEKRRLQG